MFSCGVTFTDVRVQKWVEEFSPMAPQQQAQVARPGMKKLCLYCT